jgi:hypothetical protein
VLPLVTPAKARGTEFVLSKVRNESFLDSGFGRNDYIKLTRIGKNV